MTEKNYYSLRLLDSNGYHRKGDVLKTTNKVLNIGETADSEIRYQAGAFTPVLYATIVANAEGEGWRIVKRSPHVKIQIAGQGDMGYACQLQDGDVISIEGQRAELEFHVHHDSHYAAAGVVIEQHSARPLLYGLAAVALVLVAALTASIYLLNRPVGIAYEELKDHRSSVYIIKVDSVQWIEVAGSDTTLVAPTLVMEQAGAVGTAFLTTEGQLVTARHCIEYWMGEEIDLTAPVNEMADDDVRKWAIFNERYNQEHEATDTTRMLRVFFCVYGEHLQDVPLYSLSSTDSCVHINHWHDALLTIGDFSGDYYWRTVRPYYSNQEMELGDIVSIDVEERGSIMLADSAAIAALDQSSPVAVLGYPDSKSGRSLKYASGSIKENQGDSVRVNPDILFDANISHGFSGGPVFVRSNGRLLVAGVVSKIDTDNGIYMKAVPVTEIENMMKREEGEP